MAKAASRSRCDPSREKAVEPAADDRPVNDMVGELRGPILSAAQRQAMGIVGAPSAHHGVGNLRVELNADRGRPVCVGLIGKWAIASGKQCGAVRKLEAFPMPLVDPFRPGAKV